MIKKILKIKNLGLVFSNYTWNPTLPVFKQFNLIYGWNGSGKTSLSRLFDAIGGTSIENLEYEIEDDRGRTFKQDNIFEKRIRVFNQDYIQNNVKILESRANTISVLLGEENKDLIEGIENDRKLLDGDSANSGKISLQAKYLKDKDRKSVEKDAKFTEIAKTIGAAIGGNALRDYRKPQAQSDFVPLAVKEELSEDDLENCSLSAKQESLPAIDPILLKLIRLDDDIEEVDVSSILTTIDLEARELLNKTVESDTIARLTANDDISDWVEQGNHLHAKHSSGICEYCQQKIPVARLEQLAGHFNEADRKLKKNLDILIERLKMIYPIVQSLQIPDRARFYNEFQDDFDIKARILESAKQQMLQDITKLAEELKRKKSKTTEAIILITKPNITDLINDINQVNSVIARHNKTTIDFDVVKKEAIRKVKTHFLSTIFDEVKKYDADIAKLLEDEKLLATEITEIQKRIAKNMGKISSKHKACEVINEKLTTFLGHQELNFIPNIKKETDENGVDKEVVVGYNIMRGVKPALYLSEGEKTAIAFVYFVVHLGDQDFTVSDGVIIIDDPISSLDSNSLYQAFSFLKNSIKDGGQIFIFTHSFDFLKLLINWTRSTGGAGYYMIKNYFPNNVRCAYIDKMDRELCEYESEYHYLFKLLKQLRDEQDDSIAKAYPVPNIARKVWDTFLMFRVPNGKNSYKKMDELKKVGYDEQKLDAIYKFTNDQSHITGSGFDPSLVPETKKVVKELFEMMELISPEHFKIIDKATN